MKKLYRIKHCYIAGDLIFFPEEDFEGDPIYDTLALHEHDSDVLMLYLNGKWEKHSITARDVQYFKRFAINSDSLEQEERKIALKGMI